jgi:transcriptional regulator with XRE-family HTH domain
MAQSEGEYREIVRQNLRRLRKSFGLTQAQVADQLGMKQTQIAKLENQDFDPGIGVLTRLCGVYGVSMGDLFRNPDPTNLPADQLVKRIFEMEPLQREPLLKVIEGYLKNYESELEALPDREQRLKILQDIRKD